MNEFLEGLKTAYQEAGGADGVEKILRSFYQKLSKDVLVGFFFSGKDLEHIIQQQKAFLLRSMGETKTYSGKSPRTAHTHLPPILKGHFDRRLVVLRETLKEFGLSDKAAQAWVDYEDTFRSGIVEEEGSRSGPRPPRGSGSKK